MALPEIILQKESWIAFTLSNKPEVLCWVDAEDFHLIESGKYFSHADKGHTHYIRRSIDGSRTTCLHNDLIQGGGIHDHINRIGTDNRKSNIRMVSRVQNMLNRRPPKKAIHAKREFQGIILPAYLSVNKRKDDNRIQVFYKRKHMISSVNERIIKGWILEFIEKNKKTLEYY